MQQEWQPIATYQDGDLALFWDPVGERGNGGIEAGMAFRDDDGVVRSMWTHGGPNAGSDFDFEAPPTHWMPQPAPPVEDQ